MLAVFLAGTALAGATLYAVSRSLAVIAVVVNVVGGGDEGDPDADVSQLPE